MVKCDECEEVDLAQDNSFNQIEQKFVWVLRGTFYYQGKINFFTAKKSKIYLNKGFFFYYSIIKLQRDYEKIW